MAGINASLKLSGKDPVVLKRDEAYIGVLIDDLITKGVDEPYRMFTSRAEYRILLRQDNADFRLTELGHKIGLISDVRFDDFVQKYSDVDSLVHLLEESSLKPAVINDYLESVGTAKIEISKRADDILSRPNVSLVDLLKYVPRGTDFSEDVVESAEIKVKYSGYIDREKRIAEKILRLEDLKIPDDFDFQKVESLSIECRIKLNRYRPKTIAQASRISGVSPADISVLLVYFGR